MTLLLAIHQYHTNCFEFSKAIKSQHSVVWREIQNILDWLTKNYVWEMVHRQMYVLTEISFWKNGVEV